MSEVKRYARVGELVEATPALLKLYPAMTVYVLGDDFDRVTAERDALQQRLNAAVQRIDELERGEKAPLDPPQPITEQFIEDHLGNPANSRSKP